MFHDQGHRACEPRIGSFTILEVHRVDDRSTPESLEASFQDTGFGRIEHHRQRRGRREPECHLGHVLDAISTDVVHAEVQDVGTVADLIARDLHTLLPGLIEHRLAKSLRAVRIGALTDGQVCGVLYEGHLLVQARDGGDWMGLSCVHGQSGHALDERPDVLGCGPAAATYERQPVFEYEVLVCIREFLGSQRVVRAVRRDDRQACVRHGAQSDAGLLAQRPQVFAHLQRACRTVQPDDIDSERLEGCERSTDLGPEKHRPRRLDGHLRDDGEIESRGIQRAPGTDERSLGLEQVLGGLDQNGVDSTIDEALHLDAITVP